MQLIRLVPENCESFVLTEDDRQWVADNEGHFTTDDIALSYKDYSMKAVLKAILPEGTEVPTSFETIGHIIHINLRSSHEPYKKIIGESHCGFYTYFDHEDKPNLSSNFVHCVTSCFGNSLLLELFGEVIDYCFECDTINVYTIKALRC